jgi:hypothetical protein
MRTLSRTIRLWRSACWRSTFAQETAWRRAYIAALKFASICMYVWKYKTWAGVRVRRLIYCRAMDTMEHALDTWVCRAARQKGGTLLRRLMCRVESRRRAWCLDLVMMAWHMRAKQYRIMMVAGVRLIERARRRILVAAVGRWCCTVMDRWPLFSSVHVPVYVILLCIA